MILGSSEVWRIKKKKPKTELWRTPNEKEKGEEEKLLEENTKDLSER